MDLTTTQIQGHAQWLCDSDPSAYCHLQAIEKHS